MQIDKRCYVKNNQEHPAYITHLINTLDAQIIIFEKARITAFNQIILHSIKHHMDTGRNQIIKYNNYITFNKNNQYNNKLGKINMLYGDSCKSCILFSLTVAQMLIYDTVVRLYPKLLYNISPTDISANQSYIYIDNFIKDYYDKHIYMKQNRKYIDCEIYKPTVPIPSPSNSPRTLFDNSMADYDKYTNFGYGC